MNPAAEMNRVTAKRVVVGEEAKLNGSTYSKLRGDESPSLVLFLTHRSGASQHGTDFQLSLGNAIASEYH